ncbi:MAG: HAD-IA family hydrolase [SAR202 cluster bacterium]|nr:HAD-IA family hydrolase [SAR202 cluster bacterium]
MIRAVFFDFYGTLAGWQPAPERVQHEACAAEGLDVPEAALARAYRTANDYMDAENARKHIATRSPVERDAFFTEYERRLLEAAGAAVPPEQAARIWERVAKAPKAIGLYPETLPALEALRSVGLTLGVISNMDIGLSDTLARLGIAPYLSASVSSGEVGISKPHVRIFEAALRKAGVGRREALHVGDGYDSDIVGARNAGIAALLLVRDGHLPPGGVPAVASLLDVLPYLRANELVP